MRYKAACWSISAAIALLSIGCDGVSSVTDGGIDAGDQTDSGVARDASIDSGVLDAGSDGALLDGGTIAADAAILDGGMLDSAAPDSSTPDSGLPPNVVFITSTQFTGALGGLSGADAICNARAAAAGLSGTYVAWLSTDDVAAKDRLGSARGWVRTDGRVFADTVDDIVAGRILHPIRYDEFGRAVPETARAWSATFVDGTRERMHTDCSGWTGTVGATRLGASFATSGTWSAEDTGSCGDENRLYCFGVDRSVPVTASVETGRLAFVTFFRTIAGGIAAADAACQAAADARSISGTFRAALAPVGATVASRFNLAGEPWVRADGVRLAPSASDLFSDGFLTAPPNVDLGGGYWGNFALWTGVGSPGDWSAPGTPESTCQNWSSSSREDVATTGNPNRAWSSALAGTASTACSFDSGMILCLEE